MEPLFSFRLSAPADFNFWRTAYSHGWCDLQPFSFDAQHMTLTRILNLGGGVLASCSLSGGSGTVYGRARIHPATRLSVLQKSEIRKQIRTCLRMDESFSAFHAAASKNPATRWIANVRAGRLLRAPTLFEDIVKMICTTNCTWALTRQMTDRLVKELGPSTNTGWHAFPGPQDIASCSERFLRNRCSLGYRAPYVLEFARSVVSDRLDVEALRSSHLPSDELYSTLRTIRGIGPYAAGNILRLLGRYDYLGLDSWTRGQYATLHHRGRGVKDSTIERAYEKYGEWRGLFFWLEMTREWHTEKFGF